MASTYYLFQILLAGASLATITDASMSFVPRIYQVPFTSIQHPTYNRRCISMIRGGHTDSSSTVDSSSTSDHQSTTTSNDNKDGAWEEEIRRTREFYSTPRLSRSDKILIAGSTSTTESDVDGSDSVGDSVGENVEDGRAFGSAQTTSYSANQNEKEQERGSISTEASSEQPLQAESDVSSEEEEEEVKEATIDDATVELAAESAADQNDEQDSAVQESNDIVEEGNGISAEEQNDGEDESAVAFTEHIEEEDVISAEEQNLNGEDDSAESLTEDIREEDVLMKNEEAVEDEEKSTETDPEQNESEIKESVVTNEDDDVNVEKNTGRGAEDENESSVTAESMEIRLEEDYLENSYSQEVSTAENVDGKEKDMLRPHRFERATRATASNKLVEDGLRRLQRRDGDHPSVPYVITRAMQRVLVDELGYAESEVNEMRPDVAVVLVGESLVRPDLESLPSRFYHEEESAIEIDDAVTDKSFRGTITALVLKLQRRVSTARHSEALPIIVATFGVALTLLLSSANGNKQSLDSATPAPSDLPTSIDVLNEVSEMSDIKAIEADLDEESDAPPATTKVPPDDLDKTWLDRLISLVSKPFGA